LTKIIPLADLERAAIEDAIAITGCPARAADLLGIGRMTIYRRIRQYAKMPAREDRAVDVRSEPYELRLQVAELKAEVAEWKHRYRALSTIGRAAADWMS